MDVFNVFELFAAVVHSVFQIWHETWVIHELTSSTKCLIIRQKVKNMLS